jgi:hypothetical protein
MRSHELANEMLKHPDMEVLVHINESGVPVLDAMITTPMGTRKKFLVLGTAEYQEVFMPETRQHPLI